MQVLAAQSAAQISIAHLGYIASVILFMLGIMKLGKVRSAAQGNILAALAMLVAVLAQFLEMGSINPLWIILGLVVGSGLGVLFAARVQMTQMPQLVALFNGFGGLASTFVALAFYAHAANMQKRVGTLAELVGGLNGLTLALAIVIGSVTFTGSLIAFGKLAGVIGSKPLLLPSRHLLNAALFLGSILLSVLIVWVASGVTLGALLLVVLTIATLALGALLVLPIGGGDMPVVISLLNSYSGLAAAMTGFAIEAPVLIVSGSLVGASGLILTKVMCKAMNRSLLNVLFGGFGAVATDDASEQGEYEDVKSADAEEAAMIFEEARSVIIVPGYGMAVAQAQHAVHELEELLIARDVQVRYAIHPVAGRMPGHMNVLLAEANVPYDRLLEMDEINADFKTTDVVLVIGANDVVNPAAKTSPGSPIYGMPVLDVEEAGTVFVIKRSLSAGFAGIKNELFERPNTLMIFGDAKGVVEELAKALKSS